MKPIYSFTGSHIANGVRYTLELQDPFVKNKTWTISLDVPYDAEHASREIEEHLWSVAMVRMREHLNSTTKIVNGATP